MKKFRIAFFGSSLVSAYWNGAATYYRGMIKALSNRGHKITFYEPDAFGRQQHRDIDEPSWADVVVYSSTEKEVYHQLEHASDADVIIKASGVGVFDELLEKEVLQFKKSGKKGIFWDVDAPATLDRMQNFPDDHFIDLIPQYDKIFTYGGGYPVSNAYESLGAKECIPIYNALDPSTHFPVEPDSKYYCDLAFLGNRLPDREERVEEFFINVAKKMKNQFFIIGGNGWSDKELPNNVKNLGHVYTEDHNAFNCTPKAVLNISRDSMAKYGFSPATRIFEAAGTGACIITDHWKGINHFFEPGEEILVAKDGDEVKKLINELDKETARKIGEAAYKKVKAKHTYTHRAVQVENILTSTIKRRTKKAVV